jgi:NAD(P)H-flavin reductase/Fe-S-cluster-containing hydrogenase component 2
VVTATNTPAFLPRGELGRLLDLLRGDGRRIIGPTVRDGAIVYDEVITVADLPAGWTAIQAPGSYRLQPTGTDRLFDFAVGPTSWKYQTFPPRVPLTVGRRVDGQASFEDVVPDPPSLAFLGVRGCEIAALQTQDAVFEAGPAVDRDYVTRRAAALVIAVECEAPASTCFCTSMGTGPEVTSGFDLALTELDDGFVVRPGSPAGEHLAARLELPNATDEQQGAARAAVAAARAVIGDPVPTAGLPERLIAAAESPRWAEIAERCLACANCTLVCPTCFCTSVTQASDLDGVESTAERTWDSCFTLGFAKVAGGNFRPRTQDRYRQWLTHKFGTWWDQFGMSGCVGCGRCITWCPVGIDVREELMAVAPPVPKPAASPAPVVTPAAAWPSPTTARALPVIDSLPVIDALAPTYARALVVERRRETRDVVTLRLAIEDPALLAGRPGQFVMAALPAFSAAPISVSRFRLDGLELTIRAAGAATRALCGLRRGDSLGVRGPLGRCWPVDAAHDRDVVIVTGGIGLAPLRPLVDAILADRDKFGVVRLMYGARTPGDRLFVDEISTFEGRPDLDVGQTVDRAGPEWLGRVGVVTELFDRSDWDGSRATAFICGPERMMEATVDVLRERGMADEQIYVTLERHMECGVGLCGHCQLGKAFVCRDGPVFSLAELGPAFGREGL